VVSVVGDLFKEEDSLYLTATNDGIFNLAKLVMINLSQPEATLDNLNILYFPIKLI